MTGGRLYSVGTKGAKIPAIGLGTWQSPKGEVKQAVKSAIAVGYRHIDCAQIYRNEEEVAAGIKESGIARKDLWLTSKLWNDDHSPEKVEPALDASLKNLGTDYLDLYLMHWPIAFIEGPSRKNGNKTTIDWKLTDDPTPTWRALEKLVEKGKIKHIGISNFTIKRAQALYDNAIIKPTFLQVEMNPACSQPELLEWGKKNNVLIQAYSPLGSTGAAYRDDPVVQEIAKAHSVDAANILIAWQLHRGCVVLPKSVTPSRIESNLEEVYLSAEEVERLEKRALEIPFVRMVDPSAAWGVKTFDDSKFKEAKL